MRRISSLFFLISFATLATAHAGTDVIRWTATEDADGSIAHVLQILSRKTGRSLSQADFLLQEDRDLAFNHYKRFTQVIDGLPVHGKSIRLWTALGSDNLVQAEALLDAPELLTQSFLSLKSDLSVRELRDRLSPAKTIALAKQSVNAYLDDPVFRGAEWKDEWKNGMPVRSVRAKGKRGSHHITISLLYSTVSAHEYREFPQADQEIEIPVQVYPIYEEAERNRTQLPRIPATLKHVRASIPSAEGDIYAPLKQRHYLDSNMDPVLGETEAGRAQGYWSMRYIKEQAAQILKSQPQVGNDFSKGLLLQGLYTTINIHPDALTKLGPWGFEAKTSSVFFPNWIETVIDGRDAAEMIPATSYSGKPLFSAAEAWNRPARRLENHDPASYISDGFDEIQVYYAVNTLFEELHARGFSDPELSTRPFNAFLFNPDISYRDNAYYTDDTINFTTYSPGAQNMARDNSTIWHELGHGVMDRLMGDHIALADTGGLSEGMADFLAQIVVQAVTFGEAFPGSRDFRIQNKTGFSFTNEVHDDGEAYGGAMNDFMEAVIAQYGRTGLAMVTDVVLEGMRLSRDYPGLTAADWFNHVLFADSLGRPGLRAPGALKSYLLSALAGRNFRLDGGRVAAFEMINMTSGKDVEPGMMGSRQRPIPVTLKQGKTQHFDLKAQVRNSETFQFRFPLRVRVQFDGGALQGAVHWEDEEKGAREYILASPKDFVSIPLDVTAKCDEVNRDDGSCVDYVYVQAWNAGETSKPTAKKRFYVRMKSN